MLIIIATIAAVLGIVYSYSAACPTPTSQLGPHVPDSKLTWGANGPYLSAQRLMGVGPWAEDSASISSADFNENGFIDEEDLQKIVLRLLKSDDVSEDLLMDVTHHVCIQRLKGGTWGSGWSPKAPGHQTIFFGRNRSKVHCSCHGDERHMVP